jgi:hypothetical protein
MGAVASGVDVGVGLGAAVGVGALVGAGGTVGTAVGGTCVGRGSVTVIVSGVLDGATDSQALDPATSSRTRT